MTTMHNRQRYKSERHHALDNIATGPWTMPAPRRTHTLPTGTLDDDEIESLYNETPEPTREPMFAVSPIASRVVGWALAIGAIAALGAVFLP